HERTPFCLAFGQRLPSEEIGQLLVGETDQRGEKAGLPDAMLLPQLQCDRLEPLQERRQPSRHTVIHAHFVDHDWFSLFFGPAVFWPRDAASEWTGVLRPTVAP